MMLLFVTRLFVKVLPWMLTLAAEDAPPDGKVDTKIAPPPACHHHAHPPRTLPLRNGRLLSNGRGGSQISGGNHKVGVTEQKESSTYHISTQGGDPSSSASISAFFFEIRGPDEEITINK